MKTELLAPAGDLDAAYAAFHYGADAVYLGLKRFSARAEASNFSEEELGEIVAFAHAATPRRSVFVTLNTLILDEELDEAIRLLATLSETGVDAVIVQDLGVARLVRRHFRALALHASTQLAIHNVPGVVTARRAGFSRVTLARELTLDEIASIVQAGGLEVETFIHGALCYAYSGLCLYSSMLRGRSGNRGRCAYPCRDHFESQGGVAGHPFSMKDLAMTADVLKIRGAGVYSFKIEGRKKNALYVAAVTRYYRALLDQALPPAARRETEEDIKTIFSRPWTSLYLGSGRNRDVTDAEVVGHRGAPIGSVQEIVRRGRDTWVRFRTERRLERHDGIQTDVPGEARPFGFPVDQLVLAGGRNRRPERVFEVPAQSLVEVALPHDHPDIAPGAPLYCSSSQSVKQRYRFERPKPGAYKTRTAIDVTVAVYPESVVAEATVEGGQCSSRAVMEGTCEASRDASKAGAAVRTAFERLGDTGFVLARLAIHNPAGLFVPASLLNRLRRELVSRLSGEREAMRHRLVETVRAAESPVPAEVQAQGRALWSIKVDRLDHLSAFTEEDWRDLDEVVVDIRRDTLAGLREGVGRLRDQVGDARIRLALPLMTRAWERDALREKIQDFLARGWRRWEISNISGWSLLDCDPNLPVALDLASDWPLYVTNRSAARQLLAMGVGRFTLSPEDGRENLVALLGQFGSQATVVVYQDTPLFISETCALAAMARRCPAGADCRDSERSWDSGSGERVLLAQQGCRTVVVGVQPFSLAGRVAELRHAGACHLRADFINRRYDPPRVKELWSFLRQGRTVPGHEAGYLRGLH